MSLAPAAVPSTKRHFCPLGTYQRTATNTTTTTNANSFPRNLGLKSYLCRYEEKSCYSRFDSVSQMRGLVSQYEHVWLGFCSPDSDFWPLHLSSKLRRKPVASLQRYPSLERLDYHLSVQCISKLAKDRK